MTKTHTAIEAVAEAIENAPDGRIIAEQELRLCEGDDYSTTIKERIEYRPSPVNQAKAAILAFLATPEMVMVRETLNDYDQASRFFKNPAAKALAALDELERRVRE